MKFLYSLAQLVGRDSQIGDIDKDAQNYADLYRKVGEKIVRRTQAIRLKHAPKTLRVTLVRAEDAQVLELDQDYNMIDSNQLALSPRVVEKLLPGDVLKVNYTF